MWRITFRSLLDRKLRLALTAIAIALGVAMVSATLIATSMIDRSLGELFTPEAVGADLLVGPAGDGPGATMPASVVERVAGVAGVERAGGVIVGSAHLVGRDGRALESGEFDIPPEGRSIDASSAPNLLTGRLPAGPGEVLIDRVSADDERFTVGEQVRVVTASGDTSAFTVVGIIDTPERRGRRWSGSTWRPRGRCSAAAPTSSTWSTSRPTAQPDTVAGT